MDELADRFLGHSKIKRFIVGGVLGAAVMNLVSIFAVSLGQQWAQQSNRIAFAESFFTGLGFSGDLLAITLAMIPVMWIGCLIACCLFGEQDAWFYSCIGVIIPVVGILFFLLVFPRQDKLLAILYVTAAGYIPYVLAGGIRLAITTPPMGKGPALRGTKCLEGSERKIRKQLCKLYKRDNRGCPEGLPIYKDVRTPYRKENQGLALIGAPGSGKSQIMYQRIKEIISRDDKLIIVDIKGTFTQAYAGMPGVKILSAWDSRSIAWRPSADIKRPLDCHDAAHTLIEERPETQPHFRESARHILEAIMVQLDAIDKNWGWKDLWSTISQGKEGLRRFLRRSEDGRAAAQAFEGETKASHDVYATMVTALYPIRWLAKAWGNNKGESLRDWVNDPESKILIIGGLQEHEKLAKLTIRLSARIIINEILSKPEDLSRRYFFALDEMSALEYNKSLLDAFITGRSRGVCLMAGIQDLGQIEKIYGRELAKSISNTFNSFAFLRCGDAATSEWVSAMIGDQESADFTGETDSGALKKSHTTNVRRKQVFLPSEIANFPDMTGVLKVSDWPVAKLKWDIEPIPQTYPRIIEAAWVNEKAKIDDLPENYLKKIDDKKDAPLPPSKDNDNNGLNADNSPWEKK